MVQMDSDGLPHICINVMAPDQSAHRFWSPPCGVTCPLLHIVQTACIWAACNANHGPWAVYNKNELPWADCGDNDGAWAVHNNI
jgi:hypothetical protein